MLTYPTIYNALAARQVTIEIIQGKDCQHVDVVSPLYTTKRSRISWCYSTEYSVDEILRDKALQDTLVQRFGLRPVSGWTST